MGDFLSIDVKNGLDKMVDGLEALDPRNIPFATALALTRTAKEVEAWTKQKMSGHIDRPTPFTQNSLYTQPATKQNLTAVVLFRDKGTRGAPAGKYLDPIAEGTKRGDKATERQLKRAGIIRMDQYMVPAKGVKLNAYGNVSAAQYVQVLAYLKANPGAVEKVNKRNNPASGKARKPKQFFVITEKGQGTGLARSLPPGIYQRMASGKQGSIRMLFALVRQPKYAIKYPFYEEAQEQAVAIFPSKIQEAIEYVAQQPSRR